VRQLDLGRSNNGPHITLCINNFARGKEDFLTHALPHLTAAIEWWSA